MNDKAQQSEYSQLQRECLEQYHSRRVSSILFQYLRVHTFVGVIFLNFCFFLQNYVVELDYGVPASVKTRVHRHRWRKYVVRRQTFNSRRRRCDFSAGQTVRGKLHRVSASRRRKRSQSRQWSRRTIESNVGGDRTINDSSSLTVQISIQVHGKFRFGLPVWKMVGTHTDQRMFSIF